MASKQKGNKKENLKSVPQVKGFLKVMTIEVRVKFINKQIFKSRSKWGRGKL